MSVQSVVKAMVVGLLALVLLGAGPVAAATATGDAGSAEYPPPPPSPPGAERMAGPHPFPAQLDCVDWPTDRWTRARLPRGVKRADLDRIADRFEQAGGRGFVVIHGGRLVYEWYGDGITRDTIHQSFSVSKSITGTVAGMLVRNDTIDNVEVPAPVPEWDTPGDPRAAITWHNLMGMRPGLEWNESYSFGSSDNDIVNSIASGDAGGYVAEKPLVAAPGTRYNYSTGTTNLLARTMGQQLGLTGEAMEAEVRRLLFDPLGIGETKLGFDRSGYWLGGAQTNMSSRDFARYGLLHLRGGVWDGDRLLPRDWIRRVGRDGHATQFWAGPQDRFRAVGLFGQSVSIATDLDLVIAANSNSGGLESWAVEELFESAQEPYCAGDVIFQRPLDDPSRRFVGGQQIVVRFSVAGDEADGTALGADLVSRKVHCVTGQVLKDDVAVRGHLAQRANGWYRIKWQTRERWKGCRELEVMLPDGSLGTTVVRFVRGAGRDAGPR